LGLCATTARIEREMSLDVAVALSRDAGLDLIAELTGQVPESELLSKALTAAQHRFAETPEHERGLPLVEAIQALAQVIIQSIAGAARAFDLEWLEALPALTPLTPLAPALTIVQRNLESSIDILRGRTEQAYAGYCELSERLSAHEVAGLTPTHLKHMRSAVTFALGLIEANAGQPRALTRADVLSSEPLFALSALRLRAIYALARGDRHTAEAHRAQTELLQIQNAPPQLLEGTQALQWTMGYALIADLVRVRQCLNDVEALARELHGWQPVVHYARGAYHALRGDRIRALDEYERALALTQPGRHIVWGWTAGAYIWELTRQERYAEAQERGAAFLAQLERGEMLFNAHAVRIPYALALGLRGDMVKASEQLTVAERRLSTEGARGVQLGTVYEVRAQLALAQRDLEGFLRHAAACQAEYQLGNHSVLAARHARLLRAARKAGLLAPAPGGAEAEPDVVEGLGVATLFEATREPARRAELALQMLIDAIGASGGRLYLTQPEGHLLSAQLGAAAGLDSDNALVERVVLDALRERHTTATDVSTASQAQAAGQPLLPLLLCHSEPDAFVVTGVAVLAKSDLGYKTPQRLLNALSRGFQQVGDCTPRRASSHGRIDTRTRE
jgi:tetratricopeptide (TPR) repeat protein